MDFEIDMLDVGDADAILLRYLGTNNVEKVILIDGGNPGDGEKIVNHIKSYYDYPIIDLMICTHPDKDHVGGLREVAELIKVEKVWIHDPRKHVKALDFKALLETAKKQKSALTIVESLELTIEFIDFLDSKGIPREEPFAGSIYDKQLVVVGPTKEYYEELLSGFRDVSDLIAEEARMYNPVDDVDSTVLESGKTLDEKNVTTNENNSSVILWARLNDKQFLFAGDAGVQALNRAKDKYILSDIYWFKVPHHGSKRNLTIDLVQYFSPKMSYISAKGSRKHPSRAVVNALKEKGYVYSTHKSKSMRYHEGENIKARPNYYPLEPL